MKVLLRQSKRGHAQKSLATCVMHFQSRLTVSSSSQERACLVQGKRIGVISSIANNPNNDAEINAKFAQAIADLEAGGNEDPLFLSLKNVRV